MNAAFKLRGITEISQKYETTSFFYWIFSRESFFFALTTQFEHLMNERMNDFIWWKKNMTATSQANEIPMMIATKKRLRIVFVIWMAKKNRSFYWKVDGASRKMIWMFADEIETITILWRQLFNHMLLCFSVVEHFKILCNMTVRLHSV